MQRLMNVGNEVHEELERLVALGRAGVMIGENLLKDFDSIYYAIVVILAGRGKAGIRPIAVALFRETVGVPRDVDEVPAGGFRALIADFVGPGGDCRQVVVAQQFSNLPQRAVCEALAREVRDHAVTLRPPSKRKYRKPQKYQKNSSNLPHRRKAILTVARPSATCFEAAATEFTHQTNQQTS